MENSARLRNVNDQNDKQILGYWDDVVDELPVRHDSLQAYLTDVGETNFLKIGSYLSMPSKLNKCSSQVDFPKIITKCSNPKR